MANQYEDDEDDFEDESDPNTYEDAKRIAFQKNWGLYDMLARLADGDLLKIQSYYDLPIKSIFNHLSYQLSGGVKTNKQN